MVVLGALILPTSNAQAEALEAAPGATLSPLPFARMAGFQQDDLLAAFATFLNSCRNREGRKPRPGAAPDMGLAAVCEQALTASVRSQDDARVFFENYFEAYRVEPRGEPAGRGFFTGYYEPILDGSLTRTADFTAPVLARPSDLENEPVIGPDGQAYAASRRLTNGELGVYGDRAMIEAQTETYEVLMWLRDPIELFMMQVQGSARIRMPDGGLVRLGYAGRNGHPYTSIGKILVDTGAIAQPDMSLDRLKAWVRSAGQLDGQAGRELLNANRSYVFFRKLPELDGDMGPIGGEGVSLTPLRSLAVDRSIWPYGLPVWVDGDLPGADGREAPFQRLLIAQDTGSAIVGPARGDIYVGSGEAAGVRAGLIRHRANFVILKPKDRPQP